MVWHHAHILENGNLQFKVYIGPRGNDEKGNDEKVGAEDEGAPVGKEMHVPTVIKLIGKL